MSLPLKDLLPAMPQSAPAMPARAGGLQSKFAGWPQFYALMLLAWMFDFRSQGEGAGFAIQSLMLAAFVFGLMMFVIGDTRQHRKVHGLFALITASVLYLVIGFISGLFNNQTYYAVMRNGLSVFIYAMVSLATARLVLRTNAATLRNMLGVFCFGYAVMFYIYETISPSGVDVSNVRFQIIGTSSIAALGYVILAAIFRLKRLEMATAAVNAVLLLISVTRSFLLAGLLQLLPVLIEFRRALSPRMLLTGGLLAGAGAVTLAFATDQVTRWQDRLFGRGVSGTEYVTAYTRISEIEFMTNHWLATPTTIMFGNGFAARTLYYYPPETGAPPESMIGFGHNQYVSILFTGGVLGGLPLILLQLYHGFLAFRFLGRVARDNRLRSDAIFLGAWGATIVLGMLATNLFSSSFGLRGISAWYGIGTGLLLGVQALFDPENQPREWKRRQLHLRQRRL